MPLDRESVLSALRTVKDPELFKDIVTLNMVKDIKVDGSHVTVNVELTTPACPMKETIKNDVEQALKRAGAATVHVELSANTRGPMQPRKDLLPQVKNVIAVGAGKGGVGKSTIAVNLAVGLQRHGAQVGLVDGDVYGPSIPTMLGLKGQVPRISDQKMMIPFHVHGIHAMTIGVLVEEEKPLIWRGPMAQGAFRQLLADKTQWPELDYLIVDLPPGTGDISLTLCQMLALTGAVVVATPQQVALDDAVRAVHMFQQLGAPILGIIENMSGGVFGAGGAQMAAQRLNLPFLGAIGLYPELCANTDAGTPHKNFEGDPRLKQSLEQIVQNLAGQVSIRNMQPRTPVLNLL